ncbi:MAG: hypothetical protein LQ343_004431 [Gyalolechia ehrenbergii]|nr:MAG: hypothetical protein LQ343_004431 [Gyalolechia ehrenbergii]
MLSDINDFLPSSLVVASIAAVFLWATVGLIRSIFIATKKSRARNKPSKTGTFPKRPAREPGTWVPSDFKRPIPPPYPDWSVQTTKPLPYRPHNYGPKYSITMGLRRMPWDEWIELDNQYLYFHDEKTRRIADLDRIVARTEPQALEAAYELLEEFSDYLSQRYPSLFKRTPVGIDNLLTGERFNIVERPLKQDPMQMASRLIQDDFALLLEKPDGQYYLSAGAIVMPGLWNLDERMGMPLSQIHIDHGKVPGFKEKLEKGVMSLFRRIQPDSPVQRNTWYVQGLDAVDEREFAKGAGEKNMTVENFHYRTERQTVRRLPRSGAVAFLFRTYIVPVTELAEEPYVPGRLASAIRSWDDGTAYYKGRHTFDNVLLDYLDGKQAAQVANGLDPTKEDEVRAYPY